MSIVGRNGKIPGAPWGTCTDEVGPDPRRLRLTKERALLRWAMIFVKNETDILEECHKDPMTGAIEPKEVAEQVAEARKWLEEAEGVAE